MNIKLSINRSIALPVPREQALALFDDIETTLRRFPKLAHLSTLGPMQYRWELKTIGVQAAGIAHNVIYGAHYTLDRGKAELRWSGIRGVGNALIDGALQITTDAAGQSSFSIHAQGELRDVPVPLVFRLAAPAFVQGKFTALADIFLARTAEALGGPPAD